MPQRNDDQRIQEIAEWFRERGVTVEFSQIAGDREAVEWFALMLPPGETFGPGGVGTSKVEAAEDARRRFVEYYGEDRRFVVGQDAGTGRESAVVESSGDATARVSVSGSAQVVSITPAEERDEAVPLHVSKSVPAEVEEPLERVAGEFGWYISFVIEPDKSIRWFVFDRDGETLLKKGVSVTWDDARLEMVEDLYPSSGER